MARDRFNPFESDRGPVIVLTLAEARALDWAADVGIEQLIAENNIAGLSMDIKQDLDSASDAVAMIQRSMKEFLQRSRGHAN